MENIKDRIAEKVVECIYLASSKLNCPFPIPVLEYDLVGVTAGRAFHNSWKIKFNLELAKLNFENFLNSTIPHEVAHLVEFRKFCTHGHGPNWKYVMSHVFGLIPKRCHNYDTSTVKTKLYDTYLYVCSCKDYKIKTGIHRKIQMGRLYRCRICKTPLVFKSYFGKT